ncbi:MAG: hypothetical protein ACFFCW_09555 [Candidatus Hodarchaeota archaeon]
MVNKTSSVPNNSKEKISHKGSTEQYRIRQVHHCGNKSEELLIIADLGRELQSLPTFSSFLEVEGYSKKLGLLRAKYLEKNVTIFRTGKIIVDKIKDIDEANKFLHLLAEKCLRFW